MRRAEYDQIVTPVMALVGEGEGTDVMGLGITLAVGKSDASTAELARMIVPGL